jgi:hypothetical protein
MLYLKATIIGIVTAIVLAFLTTTVETEFRLYRLRQMEGLSGFESVAPALVTPALVVGFVGGFYWIVRRARQKATSH